MAEDPKKRILIVEDAGLVRMYYREALEGAGFDVDEALNGLEALEKLLTAPVDLLIVDVNMPQMDGLTFLKALRRQPPAIASIPVLITTTESGPQDIQAARKAGANFYLTKPVGQEQLVLHACILSGRAA
ncbi:MAG TPA: response regulator [Rhodopila sp.]|nr:response regulator [Rhodopila sp.]